MTVKRLNEIAERVDEIKMHYQINSEMDYVEKIKYVDELLELSDELLSVSDSYKYFWLKHSVLHDVNKLASDLLK